jgi:hypothetical protein
MSQNVLAGATAGEVESIKYSNYDKEKRKMFELMSSKKTYTY